MWTLRPITEFSACAPEWQALNQAISDTPLLDAAFVSDLVSEFASGTETIATYQEGNSPRAMCILKRVNRVYWQTLQPPNSPIGLWVSESSCDIEETLHRLAAALSTCGMISITQQDPAIIPRPASSLHLATLDYIVTPNMIIQGLFADYLQGRSKNFRHNIHRQRNRLKRDGITTRLEFVTEPAYMAAAVSDYSALECASWKGSINSAVKLDEPQGRFYVKLMVSFAKRREALVYRYFFGDRLVASDLCLRRDGTLIVLKTACDETWQGLSPAHLMRIDAFAELFDKGGVRRVEFYGPVKEWHTRLTESVRQMYHSNYYRWQVVKRLHQYRIGRQNASSRATAGSTHLPTETDAGNDAR
jgi:CelD/BcsL family acetyltransferase involved in cellulose biosynthesis